ncbi:zinc-binding dehydrogenase [Sphingomonas immobilis]|uniref:Zinc-binding dehydrogenase n=1 Tax=Sphingomonas immobilis TaxID=3063997 RepID=A0ABT8ZYV1_9SPHN|nr:zinc-binding dehydrogenase [Sphingomonas sp. CA1-15]MDO7842165.1 zinc-binding dehydrogenase [Sphingomonas sp. CA1-15]
MRAVVLQNGAFRIDDKPEPVPGAGQILVATKTCGICGTDLHARHHLDSFLEGLSRSGDPLPVDPAQDVIFGHEFCGEVLDHGPDTDPRLKPGTLVVALPYVTGQHGAEYVGYSNRFPGGFAERMVLTEKLAFAVPNGLSATRAALTEPFAVGAHAVARADVPAGAIVMVVGCGPIGLAVIAALKARGIGPVIGIDYSPGRRRFAEALGADDVVDAARETQAEVWARQPVSRSRRAVVFECVGRPGVAQNVIDQVPKQAIVVVVGNVLEPSSIDQVIAFNKELDVRFSMNYSPAEFRQTLHDIAEGRIDADKVLTGVVAPEGVEQAFADLADGETHAKIVVSFEGA